MKQHQFPDGPLNGTVRCIHCGGLWRSYMDGSSCIDRKDPADSAPRQFVSAVDDIDAIHDRIQQLRKEQEAVTAGTNKP